MNVPVIICCIVALIICLVLAFIRKVNVGFMALPFAFLIGGLGLGIAANAIIGYFPVSLFVQILLMTAFFGYGIENGAIGWVANGVVYIFRKKPALIAWALYGLGMLICAFGAAPPAMCAVLCAIATAVSKKTGMHYYVANFAAAQGAVCGGFLPFGLFYTIIKNLLLDIGGFDEAAAVGICNKVMICQIIFQTLALLIIYLYAKGFKITNAEAIEKPDPITPIQKKTLILMVCVVLTAILVPILKTFHVGIFVTLNNYLNISSLCAIGIAIAMILKLGDDMTVIKNRVPWNLLLMITGMTLLLTIFNSAGLIDGITVLFSQVRIPMMILPLLVCIIAGAISIFSDSTSVVIPLFIPIAIALSVATGIAPALVISCTVVGAFMSGNSPFSTGGACLIMYADEGERQHWFNYTFAYSMILLVGASIIMLLLALIPMWS